MSELEKSKNTIVLGTINSNDSLMLQVIEARIQQINNDMKVLQDNLVLFTELKNRILKDIQQRFKIPEKSDGNFTVLPDGKVLEIKESVPLL